MQEAAEETEAGGHEHEEFSLTFGSDPEQVVQQMRISAMA